VVQSSRRLLTLLVDHQVELYIADAACSLVRSVSFLLLLLNFLKLPSALLTLFFDLLNVGERVAYYSLNLV